MRSVNEEAAKIFLDAAAYIKQYGWQKSGMSTHGKPRCSMGALASANPQQTWDKDLSLLMYKTLYSELNGLSLTQFNEKYNKGFKVAQLFERVASSLQSQRSLSLNF